MNPTATSAPGFARRRWKPAVKERLLRLETLEPRHLLTGLLDVSFGFLGPPPAGPPANGVAVTDFPNGLPNEQARSVAIQADGKIVVAGLESAASLGEAPEDGDIVLARYHGRTVSDEDGNVRFRAGDRDLSFGRDLIEFNSGEGLAIRDVPAGDPVGTGSTDFTLSGASFAGGEVTALGMPAMVASGPAAYAFGPGGGQIVFALPVSSVEFFFVDDQPFDSHAAVAYDSSDNVLGTVSSRNATSPGDEVNFVSFDNTLRISRIEFTGGVIDDLAYADGLVRTDISGSGDGAFAVDLQSDGKIVVAGFTHNGQDRDFAAVRYFGRTIEDVAGNVLFHAGELDPSFGGGGVAVVDFGDGDDIAFGLDIQPDGKIVLGGSVDNFAVAGPQTKDFGVARINPDGSLDASFDGDGRSTVHFGFGDDAIRNVTVQPDGKILASGVASNNVGTDMAIVRFGFDGSLDTDFGDMGRVTVDFGFNGDEAGQSIALQADGKILVVGPAANGNPAPNHFDWGVARLNPDGTLDETFGGDGVVQTDFGGADDAAWSVVVQQDGRIVVAGLAGLPPTPGGLPDGDVGLARYLSNGELDPSFGIGGKVTTDTFGQLNEAFDIALQRDGKLVAAGFAPTGFDAATQMPINDFALFRYHNDGVALMTGGISQFRYPLSSDPSRLSGRPAGLTVGPDDNIWGTDPFAFRIAKFDVQTHEVTEYDVPQAPFLAVGPHAITSGPDGHLWFTAFTPPIEGAPHLDQMGTFDPLTEQFTMHDLFSTFTNPGESPRYPHIPISDPRGGPYVYFTEMGTPFDRDETKPGALARIHVETGEIDRFELPDDLLIGSNPHGLTAGPDDNIWVALRGADKIIRFNLSSLTYDKTVNFPEQTGPNDIKYAPYDGRFYVALQDSSQIGTFAYDPESDTVSDVRQIPVVQEGAGGIVVAAVTVGPDQRSVWFSGALELPLEDNDQDGIPDEVPRDLIGRLDLVTGAVTEFSHGIRSTQDPIEIIVGPDNNLWFSLADPGFLPPPTISPLPGALGRVVPSQAEAFAYDGQPANGNLLSSRVLLEAPFPGGEAVPNVDIFVTNQDGTGETNLTSFPGTDAWGAWSPDGSKIAFATDRDGNFEIYVMNADGTSPTRLTNDPGMDYQPTWSPDGDRIAFTRIVESVIDTPGGPVTVANAEVFVLSMEIQASGVAVSGIANLTNAAGVPSPVDFIPGTQLPAPPIAFNDLEPAWSPDGGRISFTSDRDGNFEVYLMNADGSGQVNLTNSPFADSESDWSPDGSQLAFTSSRGGNGDVWVMEADGTAVRQLTFDPGTDLGPAWSPDGTQIVFTGVPVPGQDEIFVMDADGGNRTQLTSNFTGDFLPDWQGFAGPLTLPLPAAFPGAFVAPSVPPVIGMFNSGGTEDGQGIPPGGNNEEQGALLFPVSLLNPDNLREPMASDRLVTVSYLTSAAIPELAAPFATGTPGEDYIPRSGLLIFRPGETQKIITVPLVNDGIEVFETNEVFTNILYLPTNAQIAEDAPTTITPGNPGFGKITNQVLPSQPPLTITEFFFPQGTGHGGGLVVDPEDSFWLTAQFDNSLIRFDPATEEVEEVGLPDIPPLEGSEFAEKGLGGVFPHFPTLGSDGNLWITGLNDVVMKFDLQTLEPTLYRDGIRPGAVPHAILEDPMNPGVFWFSEEGEEPLPEAGGGNKSEEGQSGLGRIDSRTGVIEEFTGGLGLGARLHGFIFDGHGEIWAALEGPDQVARFDRDTLLFTDFLQFARGSGPHAIYPGPEGDPNLYVVLQDSNTIGIFDPLTKQIISEIPIPGLKVEIEPGTDHGVGDGASIVQFVAGPDGKSIWFTEFLNDRIGRLDLETHEVTEYFTGITPNAGPLNIAVGPDGNIWFSETMLDQSRPSGIARAEVAPLLEVHLDVSAHPFGDLVASRGGGTFWVNAYVKDLRPEAQGVVGGAFDLLFDNLVVEATGNVEYGQPFTLFRQGSAENLNGVIDEAGALTSAPGLGAEGGVPFVAWEFRARPSAVSAEVEFTPAPGEGTNTISPAEFALVGEAGPVPWAYVEFVSAELQLQRGDGNGDGSTNLLDLDLFTAQLFIRETDPRYDPNFDLTADGPVNHYDLALLIPLIDPNPGVSSTPSERVESTSLNVPEAPGEGERPTADPAEVTELALTVDTAQITEFSNGFAGHPAGMKLGPDGSFWFTEQFDQRIGKFDPLTLTATEIDVEPGAFPHNFGVGSDGNMYFVGLGDVVGRVELPSEQITYFRDGITPGGTPHIITAGPDGNMWFSLQGGGIPDPVPGAPYPGEGNGGVARLDVETGTITEFRSGLPDGNFLHGIVFGREGNLWAALQGHDQLARFNLDTFEFDRFISFSPGSGPIDLVLGPDGNIYATLQFSNKLGQFNPLTAETREFDTSLGPQDGPSVDQLIVGPDNRSIWFNEFLHDRVARFDIDTETVTEFSDGITPAGAPLGLAVGPDGNVWFTEVSLVPEIPGRIARLQFDSPLRVRVEASQTIGGAPILGPIDRTVDPTFFANVYVEDGRSSPSGVVGGAVDLGFSGDLASVGDPVFGEDFTLFRQGFVDDANAIVEEVGALTAAAGVGAGSESLLFSVKVTVTGDGTVFLTPSPGDGTETITPANFALVGTADPVPWEDVDFVGAAVQVVSGPQTPANAVSGFVYADTNGNGNFDPFETGLRGVKVSLFGSSDGTKIQRTARTDDQGQYRFADLPAGAYEIYETQPVAFFDGQDRIGTAGGTTHDDRFADISLSKGQTAGANNFGEAGLRPEFISRRMFLASSPPYAEMLAELVRFGEQELPSAEGEMTVEMLDEPAVPDGSQAAGQPRPLPSSGRDVNSPFRKRTVPFSLREDRDSPQVVVRSPLSTVSAEQGAALVLADWTNWSVTRDNSESERAVDILLQQQHDWLTWLL